MSAASLAHSALERRVQKLEQHADDLTRAVERLNQILLDSRHFGHVVEVFRDSTHDGGLPSVDLRVDR